MAKAPSDSAAAPIDGGREPFVDLAYRALANIAREYPNQPQLLLERDADLIPPRELHPVFFGCFDWHSAVHTHWLLLRLLNDRGSLPPRADIEAALDAAFTAEKIAVEAEYLAARPYFERPYGLAWLMALAAEAHGTRWSAPLQPLTVIARANLERWLITLRYAIRSGTHAQTAFALTLLHDASAVLEDAAFGTLIDSKALELFGADKSASLAFEPSGDDFLSPGLMEADLLRRVLRPAEFADWLAAFLPEIPTAPDTGWLPCGEVDDEADGKAVHLHGLNLSRAWNLANIAAALPHGDARTPALTSAAQRHRQAGLASTLATTHYAGDHWLPSFAVYLLTQTEPARSLGALPG